MKGRLLLVMVVCFIDFGVGIRAVIYGIDLIRQGQLIGLVLLAVVYLLVGRLSNFVINKI